MKKGKYFLGILFTVIFILNLFLLYQRKRLSSYASSENLKRLQNEWTINDNFKCIGSLVPHDSLSSGRHLIMRYDLTSCMNCVLEAEALLENVFGLSFLQKELSIFGVKGTSNPFGRTFPYIEHMEILSPMDGIYTPNFCLVNDNREIIFCITLRPEDYEYNRNLLLRLKENCFLFKSEDKTKTLDKEI